VLTYQITVDNILAVDISQRFQNLPHHTPDHVLIYWFAGGLVNYLQQGGRTIFHLMPE
jgi:hypothetical protein